MLGRLTPHDILSALGGVFIATIFLVIAFRCLRSGKSGPQIDLPEISANRASNPKLYWMFLSLYGVLAAMGISLALIFVTNDALFAIGFTLLFGLGFTIMAIALGFYTLYGFRSGKGLLLYQGVNINDRGQSPKWFWATQIQNIVLTGFFGAIGIGAVVFAVYVEYSP